MNDPGLKLRKGAGGRNSYLGLLLGVRPTNCSPRSRRLWESRLFHDRLHDSVFEVALDGRHLRLDHHDGDHLFLWIDPGLRTIRPVPAETACGDAQPRRHRVLDHTHQQAVTHAMRWPAELAVE